MWGIGYAAATIPLFTPRMEVKKKMAKFVIRSSGYTYWWPVKVRMPGSETAGELVEQEFKVLFHSLPTEEARKRFDEITSGEGFDTLRDGGNDMLREAIKDWDGICDETGKSLPFSAEALDAVINNIWALTALWRAWTESMSGRPAA